MQVEDIIIEVRNKARDRVDVLDADDVESFEAYPAFNNVGTWQLEVSASLDAARDLQQPGAGIIVWYKNHVYISGPMEDFDYLEAPEDDEGTLVFRGISDEFRAADAAAYPEPMNDDVSTQAVSHDIRSGNCEDVLRQYVNFNIGPGAQPSRRIAGLELDPVNLSRGGLVIGRARFDPLGVVLADTAAIGGLGFRFVQDEDGPEVYFRVYEPSDRRAEISLDVKNEQLEEGKYSVGSHTLWKPIVAGQGQGAERRIIEVRTDQADELAELWDRYQERFIDRRDADNDDELIQDGLKRLNEEGVQRTSLRIVPSDDLDVDYMTDWYLGDIITVVVDGQPLSAQITGSALRIDSEGLRHGVAVGDPSGFDYEARVATKQMQQDKRVASLERVESNQGTPAGAMMPWPASTPPAGWLECDGSAVSRSDYSSLFQVIGTTFGSGNGTTTFNLPNLRGKVVVGFDPSQTEFNAMGKTGGTKTHILTTAEMPSHSHTQNAHSHTQNAHSHTQNAHDHIIPRHDTGGDQTLGGNRGYVTSGGHHPMLTSAAAATNQNTTATNQSTTATNQNTGGGQAHNNLQPYATMKYVIKV